MQKYIKLSDNSVVDSAAVINARYPHAIGQPGDWDDEQLVVWGFARIQMSEPPAVLPGQQLTELPPAIIAGEWAQQWDVTEPAGAELMQLKLQAHALINAQRDAMLASELLVLSTPDNTEWQYNATSNAAVKEALLMYALNPSPASLPPFWRDKNNVNHPCTIALLVAIATRYQEYKTEIYTASWAMKAAIDDVETDTAVAVAAVKWEDYLSSENAEAALACIAN